jgi:5'-3' exonuclease|tara:strand:- start:11743 stop:12693 length:951 start_codon:yes stop_codon:yes gene_type:complete
MKRILLIDALNQFFRSYIVNPTLTPGGEPIGGCYGFLKIVQKLIRETNPDQVIICWDGPGGSARRKAQNKNYKDGRKPIRLNRAVKVLTEEQDYTNKVWQQTRLVEYLNCYPFIQFMFEGVEADDVIAYLKKKLTDDIKVIVSSDKDFYQLLDNKTVVLRPTQHEVLNKHDIVNKFDIHPNNFALARAIAGDKSDNLPGIQGAGLKTIAKRFPLLREEKKATLNDLLEIIDNDERTYKLYEGIKEKQDLITSNYKLMQLHAPNMSLLTKEKIDYVLDNAEFELNKTELRKLMVEDGIIATDWTSIEQASKRIVHSV